MRRTLLLPLALLPLAVAFAPSADARAFSFPTVSKNVGHKPRIGPSHGAAPKSLKTKDVVVGQGAVARRGATVATNYVGVLYRGGKAFDSSFERGQPFAFPLG